MRRHRAIKLKGKNGLLTDTKLFHDGTVAVDVTVLKVVKELTALTNQHNQSTTCAIILLICSNVFLQMGNTGGKQCYLALWRPSISLRLSVLPEDFFFLFFRQIHNYFVLKAGQRYRVFSTPPNLYAIF